MKIGSQRVQAPLAFLIPPYAMALVHAGLGQRDPALKCLESAYEARDVHLIFLPIDPKWDAFRADVRFLALLRRCGFLQPGMAQGAHS